MSLNVAGDRGTGSSATLPQTTASELIDGVGAGPSFNAQSIIRRNPQAAAERSTVVDLAYEEYCRKRDAGQQLDIHVFAKRFPDIEQSLVRVLEVHEYLEQNPDANFGDFKPEWPEVDGDFLGFHLLAELGRGAFSRVFLAQEIELGNRQVVVKVCEYANGEPARLGQLDHPNIVAVHSVQTRVPDGLTGICMPFLANATLWDVIELAFQDGQQPEHGTVILAAAEQANRQHTPPAEEGEVPRAIRRGSYGDAVIELAAQICDALAFAHGKGILHCDIKPSNVLLTGKGQSKLFDFNLSRQQDGDDQTMGGTLPYMAPEQVQCLIDTRPETLPKIDCRTDLFSLGVTLFQLLTGKLPFSVDELTGSRKRDARELLAKQRAGDIRLVELEKAIDRPTARLILGCLAFDPDARPESAESLARDLRARLTPPARVRRWICSHKFVTAGAVLILCELAAGFAGYWAMRPSAGLRKFTAGVSALRQGRLSQADGYFSAAFDAGYDSEEINWWREEKESLWQEILAKRDFTAAVRSMKQGDHHDAIEHFTAAVESGYEPKDLTVLLRGWAWWLAGVDENNDEALRRARDDFDESFELGGSNEAAASIAYSKCIQGRYSPAKDELDELYKAGFTTPSLLNALAICHFRLRDSKRADEFLKEAKELSPDQWILHLNMAVVELRRSWGSKGEFMTRIDSALRRIKEAKECGAPLVEVEFRLACIHAAAMTHTGALLKDQDGTLVLSRRGIELNLGRSPEELKLAKEAHRRQALASCEKALSLGLIPKELEEVVSNAGELERDDQFITLGKLPWPSTIEVSPMVLMDIYPDVIAPLVSEG